MPLFLEHVIDTRCRLWFWQILESELELLQMASMGQAEARAQMVEALSEVKSPARRLEWLATRALLAGILMDVPRIRHDAFGKPSLEGIPRHLSVTHSKGLVGVMLSEHQEIGLDAERMSDKIAQIAFKFLHPEQAEPLLSSRNMLHLYMHWCGKEALFKLYGKGGLDFKEQLHVHLETIDDQGRFEGTIAKDGQERRVPMGHLLREDFLAVWTIAPSLTR